jgi:F-type H+-transporting ATPase subunit h
MFRQTFRTFTTSAVRGNIVADLYVKELKAFKPIPLTAADAQAATKAWKLPTAAKVPALEAEGADALNAYDAAPVEVASSATDGANGVVAEEYKPDDWFVFPVDEEPGHHAH